MKINISHDIPDYYSKEIKDVENKVEQLRLIYQDIINNAHNLDDLKHTITFEVEEVINFVEYKIRKILNDKYLSEYDILSQIEMLKNMIRGTINSISLMVKIS